MRMRIFVRYDVDIHRFPGSRIVFMRILSQTLSIQSKTINVYIYIIKGMLYTENVVKMVKTKVCTHDYSS